MTELELLQYRVVLCSLASIVVLLASYAVTAKNPKNKTTRQSILLILFINLITLSYAI